MPVYHEYPLQLTHPGYAPAVIAIDTGRMDQGTHQSPKGSPARFAPVTVYSVDQEEEYLAKGYRRAMPNNQAAKNFEDAHAAPKVMTDFGEFDEYPKWVGTVIVNNADEEEDALRDMLAADDLEEPAPAAEDIQALKDRIADLEAQLASISDPYSSATKIKDALAIKASVFNVKIDGRWTIDRTITEIDSAKPKDIDE